MTGESDLEPIVRFGGGQVARKGKLNCPNVFGDIINGE